MRRAATAVALALLAGACGASGDNDARPLDLPADTAFGDGAIDPATPPPPSIEWADCGAVECGAVRVPLDHEDPGAGTISIRVARRPATAPDERIGALFVNPGGPGVSAVEFLAVAPVPATIEERFDVVAVEPRGLSGSAPLGCGEDIGRLYAADPTMEDDADRARLLAVSDDLVAECAASAGRLLAHVGTRDVARDMDVVRDAMGDEQVSYLGYSYGTSIGQIYADLFPDRVRAMVLDGVVDLGQPGVEAAIAQAEGFESALDAFAAACRARGCPLSPDPVAAVEQVLARAEDRIPAADADRPLGPGEASLGLVLPLYAEALWPTLADAVDDARRGDGTELVGLADQYLMRRPDGTYPAGFSVYFAVNCLDHVWPDDPEAFFAAGKRAAATAPHFGEAVVLDYVRCATWPVPPDPIEATSAPGSPPIVVVSTTGDPATTYAAGVRTAERLERGVLVTNEGDDHTIVFFGKACIDDVVTIYLLELTPPDAGTRC